MTPDSVAQLRAELAAKERFPDCPDGNPWPLRDFPPPAPGSLADQYQKRQEELRRKRDAADAAWERQVEVIHEEARAAQAKRRGEHVHSREYAETVQAIDVDEEELARLDAERDQIMAALSRCDARRRPVIARLETARVFEARYTPETMPIPPVPPKPSSIHVSPFAGHGGYPGAGRTR